MFPKMFKFREFTIVTSGTAHIIASPVNDDCLDTFIDYNVEIIIELVLCFSCGSQSWRLSVHDVDWSCCGVKLHGNDLL